jgi:hypothetical protein
MRQVGEEKMKKEKHNTPQHKTHLCCLCSCRVVCFSTAAALQHTSPWDSMVVLWMQGVVSRGERRKAMEGGEVDDKKDDREERGIRKGGTDEEEETKGGVVCDGPGSQQQRIKATKASPSKSYG